jgi:signal transduction histidine kinase
MGSRNPTRLPLPFIKWRGFTLQLFLFTILPLTLLLIAVAFGSLELHHTAMRDLVGDRDLRAVQAAAASLENAFNHHSVLIHMAAGDVMRGDSLAEVFSGRGELAAVFEGGLAQFDSDGRLVDRVDPLSGWETGLTPAEFEALAAGQWVFFEPETGENSGIWILTGSRTPTGDIVAGAFFGQAVIEETIEPAFDTRHTTVAIVGGSPEVQILYFTGPDFFHEPLLPHPGIAEVARGESGIRYDSSSHSEQVIAYAPIASTGWGLIIAEAWEDISSPMLRTTQLAPLILAPVLLMALVALWFGARSIIQPLQALEVRASELAEGNFSAIHEPVGGITEIRNLQEQLIDMAGQLDTAQKILHSYIGAITAGIENERLNLARELHDDTIQNLIVLNQRIQMAAMSPPDQQQAAVSQLGPLVQEAIADLRRTISGLRPIYLEDLGLVTALEMLAKETGQVSGLPVEFVIKGQERRLSGETEMMLYRMVQESLNNIIRHAEATQARLELSFHSDGLQMAVRDNGKGFKVNAARSEFPKKGHFGLLGLHERAELIGANLYISSTPGGGTEIAIHIPG